MEELWDKFWNEMSDEWFKLEVLQDYTGEDDGPSLRAWLSGDRQRSVELLKTDDDPKFTRDCQSKMAQGVKLLRVHIAEEPLSPYMRWEIEYYKQVSIRRRGEQVFIVHKPDLKSSLLPPGDIMIFDNRRAIVNSYSQNGRLIEADFYNESDDINAFLKLRNDIMKHAEPLLI